MSTEKNSLKDYLFEISQKSSEGEIPWSQPNPSTFQWIQDSGSDLFLVTIQRAGLPRSRYISPSVKASLGSIGSIDEDTYLFQVQDRRTKQTIISLSTKERPEVSISLKKIFHSAEKGMDVRASNVLKKLLGK
jgi:hypothetical protein